MKIPKSSPRDPLSIRIHMAKTGDLLPLVKINTRKHKFIYVLVRTTFCAVVTLLYII